MWYIALPFEQRWPVWMDERRGKTMDEMWACTEIMGAGHEWELKRLKMDKNGGPNGWLARGRMMWTTGLSGLAASKYTSIGAAGAATSILLRNEKLLMKLFYIYYCKAPRQAFPASATNSNWIGYNLLFWFVWLALRVPKRKASIRRFLGSTISGRY